MEIINKILCFFHLCEFECGKESGKATKTCIHCGRKLTYYTGFWVEELRESKNPDWQAQLGTPEKLTPERMKKAMDDIKRRNP